MKRILTPVLIIAIAMILGTHEHRVTAQEASGDAAAETDAGASADQTSDASSSDTSDASSADTQADTSASTDTSGETQTSTSQDAATSDRESSTESDASAQSETDARVDARGETQARDRDRSRRADSARSAAATDVDADARGRADSDADARGRASLDAQRRADVDAARQGQDARRRTDRDARGRADFDRGRRDVRGHRDNRRQRDIAVGIEFGRATDRGLVINTIERDSYFYDSGLRRGDIIVSIGGRPVHSHADFRRWIVYRPGERVPVVILRDGRRETVYVTYYDDVQYEDDAYARTYRAAPGYLGVTFDAGIPNAAILLYVHPGSPAEEAGLQPDDDILALNGDEVRSFRDALDIIRSMQPGEELVIEFARQVEPRARPIQERTTAVLATQPERTRREVRVYRGGPQYDAVPAEERYEERRVFRRGEDDRRLLDRDRDDRDEDNRGLLERVFD